MQLRVMAAELAGVMIHQAIPTVEHLLTAPHTGRGAC